jgi:hypothetical protein
MRGAAARGGDRGSITGRTKEQAEVEAGGGEHSVDAVAISAFEIVVAHPMIVFEMADHGLDGGATAHLAADGFGDAARGESSPSRRRGDRIPGCHSVLPSGIQPGPESSCSADIFMITLVSGGPSTWTLRGGMLRTCCCCGSLAEPFSDLWASECGEALGQCR